MLTCYFLLNVLKQFSTPLHAHKLPQNLQIKLYKTSYNAYLTTYTALVAYCYKIGEDERESFPFCS